MQTVVELLKNRFNTENQREQFRVELRTRRRRSGEDLQTLDQDIVHLMSLAYPYERSETAEVVARDAFLDALGDPSYHYRILERDPKTLDDALKIANRLEAYEKAANVHRDSEPKFVKHRGVVQAVENDDEDSRSQMNQIMSLLSDLKTENVKLRTEMESAVKAKSSAIPSETNSKEEWKNKKDSKKQKKEEGCRKCGQLGHRARECSAEKSVKTNTQKGTMGKVFVAGTTSVVDETYLTIRVAGRDRCALLDTGCSRSCIARKFVSRVPLDPPDEDLCAANGTTIKNLGAFTFNFKIGDNEMQARLQVSDQLDELILGIDWMTSARCQWDFNTRMLKVEGQEFRLSGRRGRQFIRRVYVAGDVVLEPCSQTVVPVKLALHSVRTPDADWVIDAVKMTEDLYSARTLLSGQNVPTAVSVINVSSRPQKLSDGTFWDWRRW